MKKVSFRNDVLPLKDILYRLALRITLDSAEAEDIVQDTLIRIWNRREQWDEIENIEAFALTICRNLALDRAEKQENNHLELDEQRMERPDQAPYKEIADILGITEQQVKVNIFRARQTIKQRFKQIDDYGL